MSSLILPNNKIENVKMVIFDKDGTLIDIHHYWYSMIEYRTYFFIKSLESENINERALYNDLMENMGIDLNTKKIKTQGPVGIKPRNSIIDIAFNTILEYTQNYTKEKVIDIFYEVDEYSKSKLHEIVKPLNGVIKLLQNLKRYSTLTCIATTDLTHRAMLAMNVLELEKYFSDIVGADLVKNAKPNSDLVDYIVAKHSLNYDEIIVIGDSMADLNMAKNAKCKFIGVKTGLYTEEFIKESRYLINDLEDMEVLQ